MDNIRTAIRNVMEKIAAGGQKNIMQEFVKEQRHEQGLPEGGTPDQYTGGFGEVRRWQQKEPSGKDPEQFDIVEQTKEHPEPVKKVAVAQVPNDIKEAMGLLHIVAVKGTIGGEISVTVASPLTSKQIEDITKVKSLRSMEGDGKNVKVTFDTMA